MSCETCVSCSVDVTNIPHVEVCPVCWAQIVELIKLINAADAGAYDSVAVWRLVELVPNGMDEL